MKDDGRPPPFALEFHREADVKHRFVATFKDSDIRVPMTARQSLSQRLFNRAVLRYCLENSERFPDSLRGGEVGRSQWNRWLAEANDD